MPKSNVNNCSQLVRIFALSSCAFLLSDHTQFCSQTVRNFALGPYAILLSDRTQFCSQTVARTHFCSQTAARTRDLPGHRTNYPVRIQIILRDREIIRMKSVHSRFREHMARKFRKHALPGDIACCYGPRIKALICCDTTQRQMEVV